MTPEERAAQTVAEWEQAYIDSDGFQSAITLIELITTAIRAAVDEAVAGEREACAAEAEKTVKKHAAHISESGADIWSGLNAWAAAAAHCVAAAIRSRGEGEGDVRP